MEGIGDNISGILEQAQKFRRASVQDLLRLGMDPVSYTHLDVYKRQLQRFKDSVKEVKERFECGLTVEKFNDIKLGDIIEGYTMEEIPR